MNGELRFAEELDGDYEVTEDQIKHYRENGFVILRKVFSPELLEHYKVAITNNVIKLNNLSQIPIEERRSTYEKAFLQVVNLWTKSEIVREFVFSKKLAKIASTVSFTVFKFNLQRIG